LIYFISDLHLSPRTPGAIRLFKAFLARIARPDVARNNRLYLLGDCFETWVGDDDMEDPCHQEIITALAQASAAGLAIQLLHGNRDFLLGQDFARAAGLTLLPDPYVLSTPTLVSSSSRTAMPSAPTTKPTNSFAPRPAGRTGRPPSWPSL